MGIFLFGIWDIPVSSYVMLYVALGVVGFALTFLHRYFLVAAIAGIGWLAFKDFGDFYRYQVNPSDFYVLQVTASIAFSILASAAGAILSGRRARAQRLL